MSTIPISLTEKQFEQHVRPFISTAKRGYECKIPLYKVVNYIFYRLHTGCQWEKLPIDPYKDDPEKKKSVMTPFTMLSQFTLILVSKTSAHITDNKSRSLTQDQD